MSEEHYGASLGLTEKATLLSACKKKAQEGTASQMPQKKHQDIAPSTGLTGNTTQVQKTTKLSWDYPKGSV